MNAFKILSDLEINLSVYTNNGMHEKEIIDQWLILPSNLSRKNLQAENSPRFFTNIFNNIDKAAFAKSLYVDKPTSSRHTLSNNEEWIKHKLNLDAVQVKCYKKGYIAINFCALPESEIQDNIAATWPPPPESLKKSIDAFEILFNLQRHLNKFSMNGSNEDVIDQWLILPSTKNWKTLKIESSPRFFTTIFSNIDAATFAKSLYANKPTISRHKLSNHKEWIQYKLNLQDIQVKCCTNGYVAINFCILPKSEIQDNIVATWPPEWFQCQQKEQDSFMQKLKTPIKSVLSLFSKKRSQPQTPSTINILQSPNDNKKRLRIAEPSAKSHFVHSKIVMPLTDFFSSPISAIFPPPLSPRSDSISEDEDDLPPITLFSKEEQDDITCFDIPEVSNDESSKSLSFSPVDDPSVFLKDKDTTAVTIDSSDKSVSSAPYEKQQCKILGSSVELPTDLKSSENLDFCTKLLSDLYDLFKHEGKEMVFPHTNNRGVGRLLKISTHSSQDQFVKMAKRKNSWMEELLKNVATNGLHTSVTFILHYFAKVYKAEFTDIARQYGLNARLPLSPEEAIAMVVDGGVNMNMLVTIFRHLRAHYGNECFKLSLDKMKELGDNFPEPTFGVHEMVINDDKNDGELLENQEEMGDGNDNNNGNNAENEDTVPNNDALRTSRRRRKKKKKKKKKK